MPTVIQDGTCADCLLMPYGTLPEGHWNCQAVSAPTYRNTPLVLHPALSAEGLVQRLPWLANIEWSRSAPALSSDLPNIQAYGVRQTATE